MLLMMAIMINISVVASWKVRASTAARQGAWRTRVGWNGRSDPKPNNWWPAEATMADSGAGNLTSLDAHWNQPAINHPIARGPVISAAGADGQVGHIRVKDDRLYAMPEGVRQGSSNLQRQFPLLPTLGNFGFDLRLALFDNRWQFQSMGYGDNRSRRSNGWYEWRQGGEWASAEARYRQADQMLVSNPNRFALDVLDRDEEFRSFYGNFYEFHPLIGGCIPRYPNCGACEIDPGTVYALLVSNPNARDLVDRIQGTRGGGLGGVPETLARAFIRLYQDQIDRLQAQQPPPQAEIERLQGLIDQLNQFIDTLY